MGKELASILLSCVLGVAATAQQPALTVGTATAVTRQTVTGFIEVSANAAEWVSKAMGKVEIERMKESHFEGTRSGRNFALDIQAEPEVMESEISGLPDLHAFINGSSSTYESTTFSAPAAIQ